MVLLEQQPVLTIATTAADRGKEDGVRRSPR
jgi:hypothetical protein